MKAASTAAGGTSGVVATALPVRWWKDANHGHKAPDLCNLTAKRIGKVSQGTARHSIIIGSQAQNWYTRFGMPEIGL
jgi:hypothetical protein